MKIQTNTYFFKSISIFFFLLTTNCYTQKQYAFDHLISYEVTFYKDSANHKKQPVIVKDKTFMRHYLTNSKNNDYFVVVTELDSLNYKVVLREHNNIYSHVVSKKTELTQARIINIGCLDVSKLHKSYAYKTKHVNFFKLNDTIINNQSLSKYKLAPINPKRAKRKKSWTIFYLLNKATAFHLPMLHSVAAYEEWKSDTTIANGIFTERHFANYNGNIMIKEQLISYRKVDKKIVINGDCDYSDRRLPYHVYKFD